MDFSQLAMETIALSESMGKADYKGENFSFKQHSSHFEELDETSTGILYRIEEGLNTFCVRGISSSSLGESLECLENGDDQIISKLKIDSLDKLNGLNFFSTDESRLSDIIIKQVVNWWMNYNDSEFLIFFSSNMVERDKNFINLGPIGDAATAVLKLKPSTEFLEVVFPVRELSYSDKFLRVSCVEDNNLLFKAFIEMFISGNSSNELTDALLDIRGYEIVEYLRTLSVTRSFWLDIVSQLSKF